MKSITSSKSRFSTAVAIGEGKSAMETFMSLPGKKKADLKEASMQLLKEGELMQTFDEIQGHWVPEVYIRATKTILERERQLAEDARTKWRGPQVAMIEKLSPKECYELHYTQLLVQINDMEIRGLPLTQSESRSLEHFRAQSLTSAAQRTFRQLKGTQEDL